MMWEGLPDTGAHPNLRAMWIQGDNDVRAGVKPASRQRMIALETWEQERKNIPIPPNIKKGVTVKPELVAELIALLQKANRT